MTDFETSIKSLRLAWIGRYLNENSAPWKSFFQYQLKNYGGTIFLKCNYNIKDYEINSQFYRELLIWWTDFREKHVPELNGKIFCGITNLLELRIGRFIIQNMLVREGSTAKTCFSI